MVHLSWPLRAYMSGDGYLSGSVAAGLPVAASLCLVPVSASLHLALVAASRCLVPVASEASDCFLPLLSACEPCPSLGPRCLAFARFSTPLPRLLASARICARNLVSSLSLKPHVDFLGVRGKKASFSKERRREAVFSFAL